MPEHTCKSCGETTDGILIPTPNLKHHGKLICSMCDGFIKWVPKPSTQPAKRRNKQLVDAIGLDYCELCLLPEADLPDRQVLEAHHVLEIELHGGSDDRGNIWVLCTACHALVHHQRRYRGRSYS